jgi:hypothetical protein
MTGLLVAAALPSSVGMDGDVSYCESDFGLMVILWRGSRYKIRVQLVACLQAEHRDMERLFQ